MKSYSQKLKSSIAALSRGKLSLTMSNNEDENTEKQLPFFLPFDKFSDDPMVFRIGETANETVEWDTNYQSIMLLAGSKNSGKTSMKRNIISQCLFYSDNWDVYFISLKNNKFDSYKKFKNVKAVAKTFDEASAVVTKVVEEMRARYVKMENLGVNNFADLPENAKKVMLIVDDADTALHTNLKIDLPENKEIVCQVLEIQGNINQIGRLSRAAGISTCLSTTRPDLIVPGELRANIGFKVSLKTIHPVGSFFLFGNNEASTIDSSIINRGYYTIFGQGEEFQAYSSSESWIEKQLEEAKVC